MLLLGLLVILIGVVLILLGIFATELNSLNGAGQIEMLGLDINVTTLFVLGLVAGVAVLSGLSITRLGIKRGLARRKENKRMGELSEKLDRAEAERRKDLDDER